MTDVRSTAKILGLADDKLSEYRCEFRERHRARDLSDLKEFGSTPAGRRVLWRLLSLSGIYRSSMSENPLLMAFSEGARDMGLALMMDLDELDPNILVMARREFWSERNAELQQEKKLEAEQHES